MFELIFRSVRKATILFYLNYSQFITRIKLLGNGIEYQSGHRYNGIPVINVHRNGICCIGIKFSCNSGTANPIGRNTKTYIIVGEGAKLIIGNNVGMSNTAINCYQHIEIGDYVKIGGGVVIYDTDFHSLNHIDRLEGKLDKSNTKTSPIFIKDHVFIGAHSIILKGVTIGEGAIIGAGSLITQDIPAYEIWGGNPAFFIKKNLLNVK